MTAGSVHAAVARRRAVDPHLVRLIARRAVVLLGGAFEPQTVAAVLARDGVALSLRLTMPCRLLELAVAVDAAAAGWSGAVRRRGGIRWFSSKRSGAAVPALTTYGVYRGLLAATTSAAHVPCRLSYGARADRRLQLRISLRKTIRSSCAPRPCLTATGSSASQSLPLTSTAGFGTRPGA